MQFRGCLWLPRFTSLWSWAITRWHFSGCICSCFPPSARSPNWRSLRHCLCSWCLATITATSLFEDGFISPGISSGTGSIIRPHLHHKCSKAHKPEKVFSKYPIYSNRFLCQYPYSSVNIILCSSRSSCFSRGSCFRSGGA